MPNFMHLFDNKPLGLKELIRYQNAFQKRRVYVVFFTARSGSSYLADLLTNTKLAGRPGEFFNPDQIPLTLQHIERRGGHPSGGVVDYLLWLLLNRSSPNRAFGLKTSYLQYKPLIVTGLDRLLFPRYAAFYLYRNNILSQAISLYIMTETTLAHANIKITPEVRAKAESLQYSAAKIRRWILHLWDQEKALAGYFGRLGTEVRTIEYQQLSAEPTSVVNCILNAIGAGSIAEAGNSAYAKVRSGRNEALAQQFLAEANNRRFLEDNGIPPGRLQGD
jgi:LPS sulfotransferase NodH